jgi:surface antigen
MAGLTARRSFWLPRYSGTAVASLRLAALLVVALGASGCAVSGPLGSMFSKSKDKDDARAYASEDVTGSTAKPAASLASASTAGLPSETDLVFARMAIVDVLTRGSKQISSPWENPSSGASGTVTPIASAYNKDGATCRDFLASYVRRQGSETWLQGEACRVKPGAWEVKSLRPWSRT